MSKVRVEKARLSSLFFDSHRMVVKYTNWFLHFITRRRIEGFIQGNAYSGCHHCLGNVLTIQVFFRSSIFWVDSFNFMISVSERVHDHLVNAIAKLIGYRDRNSHKWLSIHRKGPNERAFISVCSILLFVNGGSFHLFPLLHHPVNNLLLFFKLRLHLIPLLLL